MLPLLQANMCCIAKQKYMTFSLQNGLREKYTCSIYLRKPQYTKYHKETENLVKMIYQCFLLKTEFIPSYFFTQNSPITSHLINLKDWFHVVGKWSDLALSILVSSPTMAHVIPSVANTEITLSVLPQGPRTCYSLCQEYSFPLQHLDLLSQFL